MSCAYISEQNGVAEKNNTRIGGNSVSYVYHESIQKLLRDAVFVVTYLINRMLVGVLDFRSLLEVLDGKKS